MKKAFLLIILLFSLTYVSFADESDNGEITTILINNARETDYRKDPETGNDTIVLEGSVELSVEKGDTVSEIKADKIIYDRATEMLYADGNVVINTKSSSSGGEQATATSLLLNTSTLEGIFDGGKVVQTKSDALNLPSGSTLIVFSDTFGKGQNNVIAFKNSSLTFCEDENPHWHIDATRTWLLPGGEFAFFNALLFVGPVPVMYFPAFYYPKDELVFNPVFSIKKREGYSVQTTTYLHGRKGLEQSTSSSSSSNDDGEDKISSEALYNFMKPNTLKDQKLEGLILHNLDTDFKGNTNEYLKVLADYYSNLGFFVGVDGKFQPSSYITDLSFFLNLGFSNTIFGHSDGKYYAYSENGIKYKDSSTFLGIDLPFRYAANLNFTLSKPFRLSLSLPIYSDPFFVGDFKTERKESMDWISYFLDGQSGDYDKKNSNTTNTETSSFSWTINSSYSPSLPNFFKPYINNLNLSLDTAVNFSSISAKELLYNNKSDVENAWKNNTPTRKFYYPSFVKPAQFRMDLSGTLFSWPMQTRSLNNNTSSTDYVIQINKPDEFKTKQDIEEEEKRKEEELKEAEEEKENKEGEESEDSKKEEEEEKKEEVTEEEKPFFEFASPTLTIPSFSAIDTSGLSYNLGYTLNTDFLTQISYSSSNLATSKDFDWKNIQSFMYTLKFPLNITSSLSYRRDFFSMDNKIFYNPIFQKHPFLSDDEKNGGYSKSAAENIILADYKAESQTITNYNSISLKPFIYIDMLKNTKLSWSSNIKLFENLFTGTVKEPLWEQKFFDFKDEKKVTENLLTLDLSLTEMDNMFSQSFVFSYVMPPLLNQYNFRLNLKFPYVTASFDTGFYETTKDKKPFDEKWKKKPVVESMNISLFDSKLTFAQSFTYNVEDKKPQSLSLSCAWQGLNVAFNMSDTYGYDFSTENGWKIRKDKEFLPTSLSLSYNTPSKTFSTWSDRITFEPSLSTNIVTDLLRPTNSYMVFSPSIAFNIKDFITIKFSSTSKNSVLYWYFHNEEGDLYSDWGGFPGNMLKDLIDSFRFDNKALRENSGFKLKSLNLDVEHELHDWKMYMSLKFEPRILNKGGTPYYDFNPYFSIGVVWKPMDSLKTEIIDEYGTWKLK